jgi:hypothetical protein
MSSFSTIEIDPARRDALLAFRQVNHPEQHGITDI